MSSKPRPSSPDPRPSSPDPRPPTKNPWPLSWILIVILAYIVLQTAYFLFFT